MQKIISFCMLLLCFQSGKSVSAASIQHPLVIEVHAQSPQLEDNVKLFLETQMRLHEGMWTKSAAQRFLKDMENQVVQAVLPYGYLHVRVQSHMTEAQQENKTVWRVTYDITPESIMKWRDVHLRIMGSDQDNPKLTQAMKAFLVKKGDDFNTIQYEKAKDEWLRVAANQGYVNAFFSEKKVRINRAQRVADVFLTLDTGQRYYFGRLHLESPDYSRSFLKRFLNIHIRQPFSSKKLVQLEERMNGSGYFKQALVKPEFELEKERQVPVHISVQPPLSQQYKLGLGYGSFAGVRASAEASFPHLNQDGHQLMARIKVSSLLSGLSAKYSIPGPDPVTDRYSLGVNAQKFLPENGKSFNQIYSLGYTSAGKWLTVNGSMNYLTERYTINKEKSDEYTTRSQLVYPALSLNYIRGNDILNPTEGYGIYANAQGGSSAVLSTTDFFQWQMKGKYIHSFSERHQVLVRAGIGYTTVHDVMNLPLSMRFFAGGNNTIRGYADSSIGPGKFLQNAGLEYRHRIFSENWRAAVFWDGGMASDEFHSPWVKSYGAGLIYQSLIGPIRFYLASIDADLKVPSNKRKLAIDFSFGAEFS